MDRIDAKMNEIDRLIDAMVVNRKPRTEHFDTLREAMDFAEGRRPLRFFSGYGDDYVEIDQTDAAQLAEDYPDAMIIGSRPIGCRPGEVVIQPRMEPPSLDGIL